MTILLGTILGIAVLIILFLCWEMYRAAKGAAAFRMAIGMAVAELDHDSQEHFWAALVTAALFIAHRDGPILEARIMNMYMMTREAGHRVRLAKIQSESEGDTDRECPNGGRRTWTEPTPHS